MLTAVMFPVVSANSRPTHPALRVCVSYVSFPGLTHTCLGVRPPLGVSGPGKWQFVGNRLTPVCLSAVPRSWKLTISGQLPTPREESLSSSLWRQLSTGVGVGGTQPSCHDLPGGVTFIVSAKSPFGDIAWIGGREEDCRRRTREGSEGCSLPRIWLPKLGMTQLQNISFQAKHPRQHSPTIPLGILPTFHIYRTH